MCRQFGQPCDTLLLYSGLEAATFERIDRITNLCDRIAFDFCFEAPAVGELRILARNDRDDQIAVGYRIADGTIYVDPWPLEVASHTGYVVVYQLEGYPSMLEPVMVPFQLAGAMKTRHQ